MNLWLRSLIFLHHGNDSFPTHRGERLAIKPPSVSLTYLVRRGLNGIYLCSQFLQKIMYEEFGARFQRQECVHV